MISLLKISLVKTSLVKIPLLPYLDLLWSERQKIGFVVLLFLASPAISSSWTEIEPGISYKKWSLSSQQQLFHAVKIDLNQSNLKITLSPENERGKTPTAMAQNLESAVLVNASFFNGVYSALGTTISQGNEWEASYNQSEATGIFACTEMNQCRIYHQKKPVNPLWHTAASGIYSLVKDGMARSNLDDSRCGTFCQFTHPRTAVGLSADNRTLFFVIAEGRQIGLPGVSLQTFAEVMINIGIYNGLNLDGGGSTGLVINDRLINNRPENEPTERKVASALAIVRRP